MTASKIYSHRLQWTPRKQGASSSSPSSPVWSAAVRREDRREKDGGRIVIQGESETHRFTNQSKIHHHHHHPEDLQFTAHTFLNLPSSSLSCFILTTHSPLFSSPFFFLVSLFHFFLLMFHGFMITISIKFTISARVLLVSISCLPFYFNLAPLVPF